jgi:hypothetical protein
MSLSSSREDEPSVQSQPVTGTGSFADRADGDVRDRCSRLRIAGRTARCTGSRAHILSTSLTASSMTQMAWSRVHSAGRDLDRYQRCPRVVRLRSDRSISWRTRACPGARINALARRGSVVYVGGSFAMVGSARRCSRASVSGALRRPRALPPAPSHAVSAAIGGRIDPGQVLEGAGSKVAAPAGRSIVAA